MPDELLPVASLHKSVFNLVQDLSLTNVQDYQVIVPMEKIFLENRIQTTVNLLSIESYHRGSFIGAGYIFKDSGEYSVDITRVYHSVVLCLQYYPLLFSRLHSNGENYQLVVDSSLPESYVLVGMDFMLDTDITSEDKIFSQEIKNRIIPSIPSGYTTKMPLFMAMIIKHMNGFSLGIRWNHALCDYQGIHNFVQTVSAHYNENTNFDSVPVTFGLENSIGVAIKDILEGDKEISSSVSPTKARKRVSPEEQEENAQLLGKYLLTCHKYYFLFDVNEMLQLKSNSDLTISRNDIVHGTLLKYFALMNHEYNPKISFIYMVDLTRRGLLEKQVFGNFINIYATSFDLNEIREDSLLTLAKKNRIRLSSPSSIISNFLNEAAWCEKVKNFHPIIVDYSELNKCLFSINWCSFDFSSLKFGLGTLEHLISDFLVGDFNQFYPFMFFPFQGVMTFVSIHGKKYWIFETSFTEDQIRKIEQLNYSHVKIYKPL
ncbi:MAG: hypothetical protein F6K31_07990 [Symploca sp. SIO2G7]|nr:hypothetical protein [Symploca sp. SIO2G7]